MSLSYSGDMGPRRLEAGEGQSEVRALTSSGNDSNCARLRRTFSSLMYQLVSCNQLLHWASQRSGWPALEGTMRLSASNPSTWRTGCHQGVEDRSPLLHVHRRMISLNHPTLDRMLGWSANNPLHNTGNQDLGANNLV